MWSETNFANVFKELKRANQANVAEVFAQSTGGRHLSFFSRGAVEEAVKRIGEDVHGQYLLSFTPRPAGAAGFHAIRAAVKDRADLRVRTRAGYWPAK